MVSADVAGCYAALEVVVYGRCTISSVTSVYIPPAILTKLNFVFIFVDIPVGSTQALLGCIP